MQEVRNGYQPKEEGERPPVPPVARTGKLDTNKANGFILLSGVKTGELVSYFDLLLRKESVDHATECSANRTMLYCDCFGEHTVYIVKDSVKEIYRKLLGEGDDA